jgi:hypothetical protein
VSHYAEAASRSNSAEDTIGQPQPLRDLLPDPRPRLPALTPEEMEEVMARFREWCSRVVAKSIAQAEKE